MRSRSEENILKELAVLAGAGYKEVVFSGINLSSYGQDTGTTLAALCEKAAGVPGIRRIRLGSLEPVSYTHLPAQSSLHNSTPGT